MITIVAVDSLFEQVTRIESPTHPQAEIMIRATGSGVQSAHSKSHELHFPLMAGSSVPLTWRRPPLELELGSPVDRAVMVAYGGKEVYGFHALEGLQCLLERRKGFETGVAAVRCIEGANAWKWNRENAWANRLMREAVARCEPSKPEASKSSLG